MELWGKLRNLDAYPKVNEDFYSRTLSGGLITILSSLAILLLFFSEIRLYLYSATESKLTVDTSRGERLHINFDVTFPALPCSLVAVDTMDVSGEQHYDIIERPLQKHGGRLDHNEVYCGSCYGSEESDDQCCNSCEEVRDAYRKKGWALTNVESIDQISHKINKLSFGEEFPGVVNPLDGVEWTQDNSNGLTGMYQYFVKVVPTIYTDIRGRKIYSNQFSVTEHFREAIGYPRPPSGVYFFYEFSPIKVDFTEENTSLLHFLTNICAIVGGIFTVAGIIDSFVYHGHRAIKKKIELGKLG
ncbi:Endoplasmic reticulum-Golgi intermediate compartment protein 3 [Dichanthelium oligosanthes]|uniref:Endoplasmic reticulum-Golgi intermediate compartment protein 3 n=1 Tax=Dichanthelium oligosanthes TaxID=888268 RepID=A0A1E5V7R3_9POAL|nr:Endoplasmic reticulum-Golgi intermediate compartment protein 3 [Dichanthelium oligosanthes]